MRWGQDASLLPVWGHRQHRFENGGLFAPRESSLDATNLQVRISERARGYFSVVGGGGGIAWYVVYL